MARRKMTMRNAAISAVAVLGVSAVSPVVSAGDFADVRQLSQDAFLRLSKDLASATALRALSPGVSLNVLGIDIGAEVGVTKIDNADVWKKAGGGSTDVVTPRLTVHKGLFAGFDVGASLGLAGGTGTQMIGGIVRYQLVEPGLITPGATIRLTANKELGSSNVSFRTYGADFVVAKPLTIVTPYIGIGTIHTSVSAPGTSLASTTVNRARTFVGFDARLAFATVSAEAEKIGEATTVSSKIGFRF